MLHLSVNTHQHPLIESQEFSEAELPGLVPITAGGPVAIVSANPNNPAVLGLTNLSSISWQVILPSGSVKQIEPSRTVRLKAGTKIIFGSYAAEVINLAPPSMSYGELSTTKKHSESSFAEGNFREIITTKEVSSSDPIPWSSPKRWLPAVVGIAFLSGLTFFAISFKPTPQVDKTYQLDRHQPIKSEPQQPPGGEVNLSRSYRTLSIDTSTAASSAQWGSSPYDYKYGIAPGDQYPVACAFSVTDAAGDVVKNPSRVEYWACRIESSSYDSFTPIYWSDGKSTKYKFFANKTGRVIGTNGEEEPFEWYNSNHKGDAIVVIKSSSDPPNWTYIPGKVVE